MQTRPLPYEGVPTLADCFVATEDLPDNCIDLVLTDPPYGVNYVSGRRKESFGAIANDGPALDWLPAWAASTARVAKSAAHWYVFCSWHNLQAFKAAIGAVAPIKNLLVWEKNVWGMGDLAGDYAPQYELILFVSSGDRKLNGRRDSNILRSKRIPGPELVHPTQKPRDLLTFLIQKSTAPGEVVFDPFAGSFSTARAAADVGRRFIAFEKERKHYLSGVELLKSRSPRLF